MARRRTSRKKAARRTSKRGFNVVNAAELYLQTGIFTQAVFGANPYSFITGRTSGFGLSGAQGQMPSYQSNTYRPASDGSILTLPELLGVDSANSVIAFGGNDTIMPQIRNNIANYGGLPKVLIQSVVLKAGFTIGKKLMRKQRTAINSGIKMMGLKGSVSV